MTNCFYNKSAVVCEKFPILSVKEVKPHIIMNLQRHRCVIKA